VLSKITVGLLLVLLLSNLSLAIASSTMSIDGSSSVNVSAADMIWQHVYGAQGDDRAFNAIPVGDDFLVVGSTTQQNTTMGYALRLDADGGVIWNKTYQVGDVTELRYVVAVNSGFWFVGNVFHGSDEDGLVIRVDDAGNQVWSATLGGKRTDKLFSGVVDGDRLVVFGLSSSYGSMGSLAWAAKLSSSGDVVWNKTYGQAAESALRGSVVYENGGYLAAGYVDALGEGNYDFYLLQLNADGNVVWNKTLGGAESEKAYSLCATDGGYVLVGDKASTQTSTDAWIVKVDGDGNLLWSRTIGGRESDSPAYVTSDSDGELLVCGFTFSAGAGQRDFWLTKLSPDGKVLFSVTAGDEAFQEAYTVIPAGDTFVLFGWTDPQGRPDLVGQRLYDFWVVKLGVSAVQAESSFDFVWVAVILVVILAILAAVVLVMKLCKKR
jgi:hypothetical protein